MPVDPRGIKCGLDLRGDLSGEVIVDDGNYIDGALVAAVVEVTADGLELGCQDVHVGTAVRQQQVCDPACIESGGGSHAFEVVDIIGLCADEPAKRHADVGLYRGRYYERDAADELVIVELIVPVLIGLNDGVQDLRDAVYQWLELGRALKQHFLVGLELSRVGKARVHDVLDRECKPVAQHDSPRSDGAAAGLEFICQLIQNALVLEDFLRLFVHGAVHEDRDLIKLIQRLDISGLIPLDMVCKRTVLEECLAVASDDANVLSESAFFVFDLV